MKILLYLFCFISIPMHDAPIAFFKIYESQKKLVLEINFDTDDLSKALKVKKKDLNLTLLQEYINKHTRFHFDSCETKVSVEKLEPNRGHVKLLCFFEGVSDYNQIAIENTCLLSITNQSNIIEIKMGASSKDFRMHKGRTKIEFLICIPQS